MIKQRSLCKEAPAGSTNNSLSVNKKNACTKAGVMISRKVFHLLQPGNTGRCILMQDFLQNIIRQLCGLFDDTKRHPHFL
ncbi:hypothetical protein E0401_18365 [Escherichia coli]|nr:hypothetical protein [Escherichia coli]EFA5495012.1 hypothetical protein [Escherichia coli]EFA5504729.1 hypothetical protein [Escherichia coli]EFB5518500.1 hypothetical protein [Escherichia coli]EFB8333262.1 hypothetical protein [Escherichia coli]